MRKYQQLLLLIISLISVSLLLIYRHEYNRLHYVLEVFNFFGQPCNLSDLIDSNKMGNHHDWGPDPAWNEDDGFYAYSTHWVAAHREAKTIILLDERQQHAKTCYLWYDDELHPIVGKFKYSPFTPAGFYYYCTGSKDGEPYAVSYTRNRKKSTKKHLINMRKKAVSFNATVCADVTGNYTKRQFVEFLSFHALVGVDSYLIYTDALPYKLRKIVTQLSTQLGIKTTFYDWNLPLKFSELISPEHFIKEDCQLRASSESKFVATLSANEYLVPSTHYNLIDVLKHVERNADRFSVPVQRFCINFDDPRKPIGVQNTNIFYDDHREVKVVFKSMDEGNVISEQEIDKDVISLHRYIKCETNVYKTYDDGAMLKFSTDFIRSTLFNLLQLKQI